MSQKRPLTGEQWGPKLYIEIWVSVSGAYKRGLSWQYIFKIYQNTSDQRLKEIHAEN